jgi:protein-S-isoprenylcysteine O-methyltransferase Ste14
MPPDPVPIPTPLLDYHAPEPRVDRPRSALVWGATVVENVVLPLVYFYMAWTILSGYYDLDVFNSSGFWSRSWSTWSKSDVAELISGAMLFCIQLSIAIFLLTNRKPVSRYRTLPEILVPLLAAFFFITYDYTSLLPWWLHQSLLENDPRQGYIAFIGAIFGGLGGAVSVWGLISLGRSFGIFVAVRKVVLHGPYRYIRHPIYLGYFLALIGMLLADPEPIYFLLIPTLFAIMTWRARLEENKLASVSLDYRQNMTRTGMFLPRFPWQRRLTYVPAGFEVVPIKRP